MKADLSTMIDVMGMGVWESAKVHGTYNVTLISAKDMDDREIQANMKLLKKAGFSPRLEDAGGERGLSIQLSGADQINLHFMRNAFIAQEKWEGAVAGNAYVMRVATRGMEFDHMRALNNALKAEHIEPLSLQSKTLGPTMRVEGDDVARVMSIQKDFAPGKVKYVDKPKPEIGKKFMKSFNKVAKKLVKLVDGLKPKPAEKPLAPPDPKNFVRIWQRDENGKLVDALRDPVPEKHDPGKARVMKAWTPPGNKK